MRKFLRMIPVLVFACALLSVSAFAEDSECTDHTWEDGVCSTCGYECPHDQGWDKDYDTACHSCPFCYMEFDCTDVDNDYYCDICGQYLDMLAAGGCLHMYHNKDNVVLLFAETDHYFYCLTCDAVISLSSYYGSTYPAEAYYHTDDDCLFCSLGLAALPYYVYSSRVFDCPIILSLFDGAEPDPDNFCVYYDELDHYFCCLDCGAYVGAYLLQGDSLPHSDDDCFFCVMASESGFGVYSLSSLFDSSTSISTLVDDTTSIFSGYLDMAAVTANTVSEHPVLLVAFALPLIGVAVVLFRRIRR